MPILNLSKIKKEAKEENKDVPDELPSLPPEIKEEKKEEVNEKPVEQEKTVFPVEHLAPDELPPLEQKELPHNEEQPNNVNKKEEIIKILDDRLFFSKLIKQLNDGISLDEIQKELESRDIISIINKNLDHNTKQDDKNLLEKEIKSTIAELQNLEQVWAELKLEIEQKKQQFEHTEKKIQEYTELIKKKFLEIDELKKQF